MQPIRTASEIAANIIIQPLERISLYQRLAKKIQELHTLGLLNKDIAQALKINKKTVRRALRYTDI